MPCVFGCCGQNRAIVGQQPDDRFWKHSKLEHFESNAQRQDASCAISRRLPAACVDTWRKSQPLKMLKPSAQSGLSILGDLMKMSQEAQKARLA